MSLYIDQSSSFYPGVASTSDAESYCVRDLIEPRSIHGEVKTVFGLSPL